ncbi:CPBP family intramembrane glutamic endopeptidase [Streptomyces hoynatensis]|uniref:CPBP family intramembrane glutamic endopeptidase n=1 Tax=Streptomyces hoynatensis TaxID=1141874 RepID=UPI00240DCE19|nr:CPBP family intramembrane glutamic endopeptidase [Streptomyces hoynatensis]
MGWRCFLQPLLRGRFGTLAASATVGLPWGLWHIGVLAETPAYAAGFLLATVSMSLVLGVPLDTAGPWRLPLAGGFHALVNLGMLLCMDEETGAALPMVLFGTACLAVALPWGCPGRASGGKRGRLGCGRPRNLPGTPGDQPPRSRRPGPPQELRLAPPPLGRDRTGH